jgi:hypothetical protein
MKNTAAAPDKSTADEVRHLTVAEAESLGGILGRIAAGMLRAQGWYSYTEHPSGTKVLLIAK